ncbi:MAG TPA: hypothetical protein VGK06_12320 [Methanosarcina sp.]|jgi:hypothetical protein
MPHNRVTVFRNPERIAGQKVSIEYSEVSIVAVDAVAPMVTVAIKAAEITLKIKGNRKVF